MTVDEAIKLAKQECPNPYALKYLEKIPDSIEYFGSEGFRVQIAYALNNMAQWRGETAREVKKTLRLYVKRKD